MMTATTTHPVPLWICVFGGHRYQSWGDGVGRTLKLIAEGDFIDKNCRQILQRSVQDPYQATKQVVGLR